MLQNFQNGYGVSKKSAIAKREKNDCMVRAVANAFEIPYDQSHAWVKDVFKRGVRQGTNAVISTLSEIDKAVFEPQGQLNLFNSDEKQITIKPLGTSPKRGGKLQNPAYTHKPVAYSVKAFAERFKKGNYVVLVNKHALAIKNGVIVDNADMQFKGYRRVVESAFQIKIA
tara:strand:- start:1441 stop:1950 length:510 start_codon:yes stop_codon:yes gene_type:complete